MKKILFIFIMLFGITKIVNASTVTMTEIPYYYRAIDEGKKYIMKMRKLYDKETNTILFNYGYRYCSDGLDFKMTNTIPKDKILTSQTKIDYLNSIIFYGYLTNPTDLNYYLTQMIIWKYVSELDIAPVDEAGIPIDYHPRYQEIIDLVQKHSSTSPLGFDYYDVDLWDTLNYTYPIDKIFKPTPVDGLIFTQSNTDLSIYNEKVGNYKIDFTLIYPHIECYYYKSIYKYIVSYGAPASLKKEVNYNVKGIKFNVKEILHGVNGLYGDASSNSTYNLYYGDELKYTISNKQIVDIRKNSDYLIKNMSNDEGYQNIEDINFSVSDEDYTLYIDKYVISKNISISLLDNYKYKIYLKSNNEIYYEIDSNTNLITLPYGTYYIVNDNGYCDELIVEDSIDEELVLSNNIEDINLFKPNEIVEETTIEEEQVINESIILDNPRTNDYIYLYVSLFLLSLLLIIYIRKVIFK